MEDYVDDIVIKSKEEKAHIVDLRRVFKRCRLYKMRMNPLKYAFGISLGKFHEYMVHRNRISMEPENTESIYFIPALVKIFAPLQDLLRGNRAFTWGEPQQSAFKKIKPALVSPAIMIAPEKGKPLLLYLTSTQLSIGALLAQDKGGEERPVYYLSTIRGAEANYKAHERHCFALTFAMQKFNHYILVHKLHVVTKSDPINFILNQTVLTRRLSKWLLLLAKYDIKAIIPPAIKSQALADLLAHFPAKEYEPMSEEIPRAEANVFAISGDQEWRMTFDGSSTTINGGAGVVLVSSGGACYSFSFKLDFPCTNNEVEYEALTIGLFIAAKMGIFNLCVQGNSHLIIQ